MASRTALSGPRIRHLRGLDEPELESATILPAAAGPITTYRATLGSSHSCPRGGRNSSDGTCGFS